MPSDVEFRPEFIPQTLADRVQRSAVLHSLYGPCYGDGMILRRTASLVALWRRCLIHLPFHGWSPRGWTPEGTPRGVAYARNCCPSFVYYLPRTKPCHLTNCPFCYARGVRAAWNALQPFFTGANATYDLIERRHSFRVPFLDTKDARARAKKLKRLTKRYRSARDCRDALPSGQIIEMQQWLSEKLSQIAVLRGRHLRSLQYTGALAMTLVSPWPTAWQFEHRQLYLVPSTQAENKALEESTKGHYQRHVHPDPRTLLGIVARVYAYPRLWLYGDPAMLAILQNARAGTRLSATYGVFRNHRPAEA